MKLNKIIILSDGIRGHFHQSLGVAKWLERLSGAEIMIIEVPKLSGLKRFFYLKPAAQLLKFKNKNYVFNAARAYALKWLKLTGFELDKINFNENKNEKILVISTGSTAAPFCLAISALFGDNAKSAVIMTPSIGIKNFDFAIVPEHDKHHGAGNILTTLGAPNHIYRPELKSQAGKFFADIKFHRALALLIGGSDANYEINTQWSENVITELLKAAEAQDVDLLITTSRRTGKAVDDKIESILKKSNRVKYFLAASRSPDENPVPAMLGAAAYVIVTEDSVSMASEAVTAGFHVGLLRTGRKSGFLIKLRNLLGGGTSRFDKLFESMINKNMMCDLGDKPDFKAFCNFLSAENTPNESLSFDVEDENNVNINFNEAERAAKWILERL